MQTNADCNGQRGGPRCTQMQPTSANMTICDTRNASFAFPAQTTARASAPLNTKPAFARPGGTSRVSPVPKCTPGSAQKRLRRPPATQRAAAIPHMQRQRRTAQLHQVFRERGHRPTPLPSRDGPRPRHGGRPHQANSFLRTAAEKNCSTMSLRTTTSSNSPAK